jgi:hypothetical protein
MVVSSEVTIEGFGYHTDERLADVISQEIAEVEN